ncbi:hypothetical protein [Chitinophaga sp. 22620]|uniref:hypothetical protein n=1 Tax=Chitinophaga sp. 22620 TaxID=3453952 RepID=UPI003F82DA3E
MQKHAFCCLLLFAFGSMLLLTSCKKDGNGQNNGNDSTENLSGRYYIATSPINTDRERRYLLAETVHRTAEGRQLSLSYHSSLADVVDTVYVWTVEKLGNGYYAVYKIGHNIDSPSRVYWTQGERNNPVLPTAIRLTLIYEEDMPDRKPGPNQQFKIVRNGTGNLRITTSDGKPPIFMAAYLKKNGAIVSYELYGLFLDDTQPSCMWKTRADVDSIRYCFIEGVSFRK